MIFTSFPHSRAKYAKQPKYAKYANSTFTTLVKEGKKKRERVRESKKERECVVITSKRYRFADFAYF